MDHFILDGVSGELFYNFIISFKYIYGYECRSFVLSKNCPQIRTGYYFFYVVGNSGFFTNFTHQNQFQLVNIEYYMI